MGYAEWYGDCVPRSAGGDRILCNGIGSISEDV
jgi:hypothetical protein